MTTSTITWKPVAEGLPDVESNVLLGLSSGFTCEGFLDTDHEGAQVWRDVCAVELEDAVVAWAEMPLFDSHADSPPAAPASAVLEAQTDGRKLCTCDGAGRGAGRRCVVQAGGRLGDLWRCSNGLTGGRNASE